MSFSEWKQYKLGEVLDTLIDYRGKTPKKTLSGIPLITAKIVKNGFIEEPNEFIATEDYAGWMTRGFPEIGDVVLTVEAPLGEVAQIKSTNIALAQRIITLRGKKGILDNGYLKYYFQSEIGQRRLKERETGTTVTGIKQSELLLVKVNLPDYKIQKHIASILSSLDDKIELNHQTSQTLKAIAETLFTEMCLPKGDKLAEGWRVGKLADVCEVNNNTISKKFDSFEWIDYIEISEVNKGVIGNLSRYEFGKEPSRAKRKLKHGDVALSTVRPDRGAYFLAINPPSTNIVSTGFAVFSAMNVPFSFLYLFLTSEENLKYYGHVANGGAYPALNPNVIMNMELVIPSTEILDEFHRIVEPLLFQIHHNQQEIKTLISLRDHLLPKLMKGEIEIGQKITES